MIVENGRWTALSAVETPFSVILLGAAVDWRPAADWQPAADWRRGGRLAAGG
jgi:hypothetical protein